MHTAPKSAGLPIRSNPMVDIDYSDATVTRVVKWKKTYLCIQTSSWFSVMGCGVSKSPIPTPNGEGTDSLNENGCASVLAQSPVQEPILSTDSVREDRCSLVSVTPKSTDSGENSPSVSEDDSDERQLSPIRMKPQGEDDIPTKQNPLVADMKKGFVAFDIPLEDSQDTLLENVLKKPLPRRLRVDCCNFNSANGVNFWLQHLEPLGHAPQITTELLMEKLEKAEEKRQKTLAKWREQSARRREAAIRRSEYMGDNNPTMQPTEEPEEEYSKNTEQEKKCCQQEIDESLISHLPSDENRNDSENWSMPTVATGLFSPTNLFFELPQSEEAEQTINQNNNSVEAGVTVPDCYTLEHSNMNYSGSWPTLLSHEQNVGKVMLRASYTRRGCYLQAVQEEDGENDTDEDDDDSEPESVSDRLRSKPQVPFPTNDNCNNNCGMAEDNCKRTSSRAKGF
ncbi:uncharacterized protein DEA37_0003445 [Paragonimus westermani]|uniref:Uncharacterized protein n=1 Tax=Paragonimus westermani TaxID=34504 RepID=A0A5J4NHV2_9TREM|nr:uncharacterized protein DEA37_0003445 [Paragonimus westermani]